MVNRAASSPAGNHPRLLAAGPGGVGPLNRRLAQLRGRLHPALQAWLPDIPPPTARNLWLLLALLVATQSCAVFYSSQSANVSVLALMIWGGSL